MNTAAALNLTDPTADVAPISERRTTIAADVAALLTIEAQIAALRTRADVLKPALLARFEAECCKTVTAPGYGSVTFVAATTRTSLDSKAAEAMLVQLGQAVPVTSSNVKASLRVNCNK